MIGVETTKPPAFDVVVVHSLSHFFRDQLQLEFYVCRLAKNAVRLVLITQELGAGPMSNVIRQIMALFDVLGPQHDYFADDQIAAFLAGPWSVSTKGDRMAYFLDGPQLTHARGYNIVSDGIATGTIQVPGDGRPIVLMADRQSTGGYPKIATIIGPDLGRMAQARPGTRFGFEAVSIAEAVAARREEAAVLARRIVAEPCCARASPPNSCSASI
jgi:allophanate hydrolase subunit 2